ncbi:pentatricopeptide repeat-containing protein At3g46790, chloroplastic [Amborella trichopoda]|uniref:pentatricopeptide repeat-containing protein At3g46790, chloroplastic n=1 Tax=Amborella trichopoda TaxID=13333 RepID=UPI0005D463E7|nr:pentatricopeptide repeat-containing protein At3g46790, chloroplastic [Amborella trichopoda]|eukprot:XP_011629066.1 pentatricopeptide repeat-containing protein At3g46790, chloroplastic [Amborella trichopoda]
MGDLEKGKEIHRDAMMAGMDDHTYVCNWLRAMYARCGGLTDARQVFDEMPERDVISWNSMIAGYSQNDRPKEALELFHGMLLGFRVGLDGVTLVAILPSLSQLSALGVYGVYGLVSDALETLSLMLKANISPNAITFVYVLLACAHVGLVDVARQWFQAMRDDHSLEPSGEHYACMVDALGRAGLLDEAMTLINSMPFEPGADVWGSLLGACRIHKDVSLAERAAERVFMLDPLNEG